jgi:hypothetical protein
MKRPRLEHLIKPIKNILLQARSHRQEAGQHARYHQRQEAREGSSWGWKGEICDDKFVNAHIRSCAVAYSSNLAECEMRVMGGMQQKYSTAIFGQCDAI